MIELPSNLLKNQLESQLKRGLLISTELMFRGQLRFKRLILLNKNFSGEDIFYALTTSQVDFYVRSKNFIGIRGNFLYLQKGQTKFNLDEDMVINCRKIDTVKKNKLLQNYSSGKLKFLGIMPDQTLSKIDTIIEYSILISPKIKEFIL